MAITLLNNGLACLYIAHTMFLDPYILSSTRSNVVSLNMPCKSTNLYLIMMLFLILLSFEFESTSNQNGKL